MRKFLAKILILIAVGLQFSHQVLAHHHPEETETITTHHHDDHDDDDDHDTGHFPAHHIADIFSVPTAAIPLLKIPVQDIQMEANWDLSFQKFVDYKINELIFNNIGPPISGYYKYFSLRAPPAS